MESQFHDNSVFFIEVDKVKPNPFQPRKEFDDGKLHDLADSIKMYGILQPLVVTRKEVETEDGGLATEYELIAGERRLRASKIAGVKQVPALIRSKEDDDKVKLELAIIENLQREDLNPIDRATAFQQLVTDFKFKHIEVAKKVGRSREYVSNSIRLLSLPDEIQEALSAKKISEGHARTLLMLTDRREEQAVLFKEIMVKRLTVRDAEKVSRKIAFDKVRKKERMFDPEVVTLEEELSSSLGTRVHIERKNIGGKIEIDYFSNDDLKKILELVKSNNSKPVDETMNAYIDAKGDIEVEEPESTKDDDLTDEEVSAPIQDMELATAEVLAEQIAEDENDEDSYDLKHFSV